MLLQIGYKYLIIIQESRTNTPAIVEYLGSYLNFNDEIVLKFFYRPDFTNKPMFGNIVSIGVADVFRTLTSLKPYSHRYPRFSDKLLYTDPRYYDTRHKFYIIVRDIDMNSCLYFRALKYINSESIQYTEDNQKNFKIVKFGKKI